MKGPPASRSRKSGVLLAMRKIGPYTLFDTRSKWHKPAFGEFRLADHQEMSVKIDVTGAQARHFSYSQAQTIHEQKGKLIRLTSLGATRGVRQLSGGIQQLTCLTTVEYERRTLRRLPARLNLQW